MSKTLYSPTASMSPSKKRTVLKDSSWIKRDDDDDDSVFQTDDQGDDLRPAYKTGSVGNLMKRFGGSQDFLDKNSKPKPADPISTSSTRSSITRTSSSDTKTVSPGTDKPTLPSKPSTGRSSFTDKVFSTNKPGLQKYSSPPSKTSTLTTETTYTKDTSNGVNVKATSPISSYSVKSSTVTTPKSPEPVPVAPATASGTLDDLADTLIPSPTKSVPKSPVKASSDSNTLESLADTLLPSSIQHEASVDNIPGSQFDRLADTLSFSSSRSPPPEKVQSVGSPLDSLSDSLLSSPTKTVTESSKTTYSESSSHSPRSTYTSSRSSFSNSSSPKRTLTSRDLCSFCQQPIVETTRMIVDDLQLFSHAACFKCAVCHCNLGNLEAGDSLWVHRNTVNCDNCYNNLRDRWFR